MCAQFIGVNWHARNKKWVARLSLRVKGKLEATHLTLGYHTIEVAAAKARDK